jgi:hypothetical protein
MERSPKGGLEILLCKLIDRKGQRNDITKENVGILDIKHFNFGVLFFLGCVGELCISVLPRRMSEFFRHHLKVTQQ